MRLNAMMSLFARALAALLLTIWAGPSFAAEAEEGPTQHYPLLHPKHVDWTFAGPFGKFDPAQLQRGFQVYREVCSGCHSLSMVAFRNLASETGPTSPRIRPEPWRPSIRSPTGRERRGG
jgi:ubiquinol-cytochrome c reductase cytochrome c1 subunit